MKYVVTNVSARFGDRAGGSSISVGGRVIRPGQTVYFDELPEGAKSLEQAKMVSIRQVDKQPLRVPSPPPAPSPSRDTAAKKRKKTISLKEPKPSVEKEASPSES